MKDLKFKFEDIYIGLQVRNLTSNEISTVINLTVNSIEVFNKADRRCKDSEGNLKGIDSTNWYTLDSFNKKFQRLTVEES